MGRIPFFFGTSFFNRGAQPRLMATGFPTRPFRDRRHFTSETKKLFNNTNDTVRQVWKEHVGKIKIEKDKWMAVVWIWNFFSKISPQQHKKKCRGNHFRLITQFFSSDSVGFRRLQQGNADWYLWGADAFPSPLCLFRGCMGRKWGGPIPQVLWRTGSSGWFQVADKNWGQEIGINIGQFPSLRPNGTISYINRGVKGDAM